MEIQANTGVEVFRVDAFAREVFRGNPAMVCISRQAMRDEAMQRIASEFNVSETVFLSPRRGSERTKPQKEVEK